MITINKYDDVIEYLVEGKVGFVPSDTVYGLSCIARNKDAVERIYKIKGRDYLKPFIILISAVDMLSKFGIIPNEEQTTAIRKYWPGKNSLIFPCANEDLLYLHRTKKSLAFRQPDKKKLTRLINRVGPIVSTTANKHGEKTATNVAEGIAVFGNEVEFYLDDGTLTGNPSNVYEINEIGVTKLR